MAERKHKRVPEGIAELDEDASVPLEATQIEVGSGYTLSVRYDENDRPLVDIKTYGQVDLARVRREIEGAFPNAQIRQNEQSRTVTVAKKNKRKLGGARKRSR